MPCCATQLAKPCHATLAKPWGRRGPPRRQVARGLQAGAPRGSEEESQLFVFKAIGAGAGSAAAQEGAEQTGQVFKPFGSWRSQQGRGKGAACLAIALINQAGSKQDPTLSTPHYGLCHPHRGQVPHHPLLE